MVGFHFVFPKRWPIQVCLYSLIINRKINTSPTTVDEKDILTKLLVTPAIRAIELHFKHGLVVHARNKNGVTIKDALDAIHHKYKKRVRPSTNTVFD